MNHESHADDVSKHKIWVKCKLWAVLKYIHRKYDILSIGKFQSA